MTDSIDEETQLRAQLHDVAGAVGASDDLFGRVRSGAAHRRKTRAAVGALALVAVAAAGVGGALAASGGSSNGALTTSPVEGSTACPASLPGDGHLPTGHAGMDKMLVPGSPVEAVVCDYKFAFSMTTAPGSVSSLTKSQALTGSSLTAVVKALQKPVYQHFFPCPTPSVEVYIQFRYAQGPDVAVEFGPCPVLSNGVLEGNFDINGTYPPVLSDLLPKT